MAGLMDFLQAASNAAASNVSGPVDILSWAFKKDSADILAGLLTPAVGLGLLYGHEGE
jgi:hypothetical protein